MEDLTKLHSSHLNQMKFDIDIELNKRKQSKKIPVFGVCCGFRTYEFMTLEAATNCLQKNSPEAIKMLGEDTEKGLLDGWNGDVVRLYVNHVNGEDYEILKEGFFDNRYKS